MFMSKTDRAVRKGSFYNPPPKKKKKKKKREI